MSERVTAEQARERVSKLRAQTIAGTKMAGSLQLLDAYIDQAEAEIEEASRVANEWFADREVVKAREAALVEALEKAHDALIDADAFPSVVDEVEAVLAAYRGGDDG